MWTLDNVDKLMEIHHTVVHKYVGHAHHPGALLGGQGLGKFSEQGTEGVNKLIQEYGVHNSRRTSLFEMIKVSNRIG